MKKNRIFAALASVMALASCVKEQDKLITNVDTGLLALEMDEEYVALIDRILSTAVVAVPADYDASAMTLTRLELPEGASANVKVGEVMNMNFPQTVKVSNGDVFSEYTLTVQHDRAEITSFRLNGQYVGIINQTTRTIAVRVPSSVDVTAMTVEIKTTEGCTVEPETDAAMDFSSPVTFTVTYNTAKTVYTVNVEKADAPKVVYIGLASSYSDLNPEEKAAVEWMISTVPASQYISFDDVVADRVDLSQCELVWWHLHIDGGIDNMNKFDNAAPASLNAVVKLQNMYESGVNFLLTRYATYYAAKIGAIKNGAAPNNCWGQNETEAETAGNPWYFFVDGYESHPVWNELVVKEDGQSHVYTFDTGYRTTNSTAQWHIGEDWGGYASHAVWEEQTGGKILAKGGDGAIVAWEFPAADGKGGVVCIGSGCYDWYAHDVDTSEDRFHANVGTMTLNAINYLIGE